jgi:hypothetical protein
MPGGVGGQRRKPLPTRLANKPALLLKAASQRNIIITSKIQFPTIQFHIPVRCTLKNDYYDFVLSIFRHAVACFAVL